MKFKFNYIVTSIRQRCILGEVSPNIRMEVEKNIFQSKKQLLMYENVPEKSSMRVFQIHI